jgi:cytoskeletal protein CcmA (bactofilin family)
MKWRDDWKASPMDTLIDPGTVFEGDIQSEGGIAVEGTVKGRIVAKGEVMVKCYATVEAEIVAGTIRIEGCVTGNVTAYGRLEVGATGRITGDVETKAIGMKEGGTVNGIIRMQAENLAPMKQLPPPGAQHDSDSSYH